MNCPLIIVLFIVLSAKLCNCTQRILPIREIVRRNRLQSVRGVEDEKTVPLFPPKIRQTNEIVHQKHVYHTQSLNPDFPSANSPLQSKKKLTIQEKVQLKLAESEKNANYRTLEIIQAHTNVPKKIYYPQSEDFSRVVGCTSNRKRRQETFICRISREDLNRFTERDISENQRVTGIDTEEFLLMVEEAQLSGNHARETQLVEVAQHILETENPRLIGSHELLFRRVLEFGSLTNFYNWQSTQKIQSQSIERLLSSSKLSHNDHGTASNYMGMIISFLPMIESGLNIKSICASNDTAQCTKHKIVLGLAMGMFVTQMVLPKVIAWAVCFKLNAALSKLSDPSSMMHFQKVNELETLRASRLLTATTWLSRAFLGFGMIMEGYLLYEVGTQWTDCIKSNCDPMMYDFFIGTIAMSLVRIGVMLLLHNLVWINPILAAVAFIGLWVVEKYMTLIIRHKEYAEKYHPNAMENFDYYVCGLFGKGCIEEMLDGLSIALTTANDRAISMMEKNVDYVAVAVATGHFLNSENILIGYKCEIDMRTEDIANSRDLGRLLPPKKPGMIQLCLPHHDTAKNIQESYSHGNGPVVSTSVYWCDYAIVIGHEKRWNVNTNGTILYALDLASTAQIWGHNVYTNHFLVGNLGGRSKIVGGKSSNIYVIAEPVSTTFVFNTASKVEVFDFFFCNKTKVDFSLYFNGSDIVGNLKYQPPPPIYSEQCKLQWDSWWKTIDEDEPTHTMKIVGRRNKKDSIQCADENMLRLIGSKYYLLANGNGGFSSSQRDVIRNCHFAALEIFTDYIATYKNITYNFEGSIGGLASASRAYKTAYSTIELSDAKAWLSFEGQALHANTYSMQYSTLTNTLTWKLLWSHTTIMVLEIKGYYRTISSDEKKNSPIDKNAKVEAVRIYDKFVEGYFQPEIKLPQKINDSLDVEITGVILTSKMKGSTIKDAIDTYNSIHAIKNPNIKIQLLIASEKSEDIFYFGTDESNEIILEMGTRYAAGLDGCDFYTLAITSAEYIWINNEATDNIYDQLIIPDGICDSLTVHRFSKYFNTFPVYSKGDVVVKCQSNGSSRRINVILQQYLLKESHQHLTILWKSTQYMIAPEHWRLHDPSSDKLTLFEYFSMKSADYPMIVNFYNNHLWRVLHVNDITAPFKAYKDGEYDLILTQNGANDSFIRLKHFYTDYNSMQIYDPDWYNLYFIIIKDFTEHTDSDVITFKDIVNVIEPPKTTAIKITEMELRKKYSWNSENVGNIVIRHNDVSNSDEKLGFLYVQRIWPKEIYTKWNSQDSSLTFCTKKSCVVIENWCESQKKRLNSIEFHWAYGDEPIIISNIDLLDCFSLDNEQFILVSKLNDMFIEAQKLVNLSKDNTNDVAIFDRCIAIFYAENATTIPMFRIFGFSNIYDQGQFVNTYCRQKKSQTNPLYDQLKQHFINLTQDQVRDAIELQIQKYNIRQGISGEKIWPDQYRALDLLRKSFQTPEDFYIFKSIVFNYVFPGELTNYDFERIAYIRNRNFVKLPWYEKFLRYLYHCM